MKIGILTFHWATNYGAVLQCYALQTFLESKGHDVVVINYKPQQYDDNLYSFIMFRKFLNIPDYLNNRKKEFALSNFRDQYLKLTERVYCCQEIPNVVSDFDIIFSGSDQVLNPTFLLSGERRGVVSPAYFLGFPFNGKRIGYALSFGCVTYPQFASELAKDYIKQFDVISVRENTGVSIVRAMGRNDAFVAPDPSLLMSSTFYQNLADQALTKIHRESVYCFFIRHLQQRKSLIGELIQNERLLWNNDDNDYTLQGWLFKIKVAKFVVTDSFHCVVMCLKFHKPFVVVTEAEGNVGMNDRLYTLLGQCQLTNRILSKSKLKNINVISNTDINWNDIDMMLNINVEKNTEFLNCILNEDFTN